MDNPGIPADPADLSLFAAALDEMPDELFETFGPQEGGTIAITLPTKEEMEKFPPGEVVITVTNTLSGQSKRVRIFTDCLDGKMCQKVVEALIFNLRRSHEHVRTCQFCQQYAQSINHQSKNSEAI